MRCLSCHQELPDSDFLEKVQAILGPDLELFDFGGGITVIHMPDLQTDSYFTSYMAAVLGKKDNIYQYLSFEIVRPAVLSANYFEEAVLSKLPWAKENFQRLAQPVLMAPKGEFNGSSNR